MLAGVKPLLIGLAALLLAAEPPPFSISAETRGLIDRAPAVASPLTGYLTLGEFFVKNGKLDRAKQIFAYGLLHAPSDPRFLSWLAVVEEQLGHQDFAREYALAALSFEPGAGPAQDVLMRLKPPEASPAPGAPASPDASPKPESSPSTAASPKATASPQPGASAAPAPPKLTKKDLELLATAVGAPSTKELEGLSKPPAAWDPKVAGDKLKALGVLRTVDAALKMYTLNHPKEEIKALDLKKLVEDKVLPKEVDLSGFPAMTYAEKKLSMEGFGTLDELAGGLSAYAAGLDKSARYREKGLMSEAHAVLLELSKKFEGDPELYERLLRIQLDMNLDFPAADTARKLFLARPTDPRHLWTLAVLFYRTRAGERARSIASVMPKAYNAGFYTPAARALVALVDAKVSPEVIQKLVAERQAALEAEAASPAAPEPPPASPGPSASPSPGSSPAPSPSPAQ